MSSTVSQRCSLDLLGRCLSTSGSVSNNVAKLLDREGIQWTHAESKGGNFAPLHGRACCVRKLDIYIHNSSLYVYVYKRVFAPNSYEFNKECMRLYIGVV